MQCKRGYRWLVGMFAVALVLQSATASVAQVRRYEPTRPTVSPYLRLFQDDRLEDPFIPNYHTQVRPLQQQLRTNETQRRLLLEQRETIGQLQAELRDVERRQAEGPLVAPTGRGSWFNRPAARGRFQDTSRFYSQSGSGGRR